MKKSTAIFQYIKDNPYCRRKDFVKHIYEIDGVRTYDNSKRGHYSQNITSWVRRNLLKSENGRYTLTNLGLENINHPYKRTPEEVKAHRDWLNSPCEMVGYEEFSIGEYHKMMQEQRKRCHSLSEHFPECK